MMISDALTRDDDTRIRFCRTPGSGVEVMFLSGFRSDMEGSKAVAMEAHVTRQGRTYTRFDYRGHGSSDGRFEELCLSDWLDDTLLVIDQLVTGRAVLIGSSMGGWLMLLAALARPEKVAGLVGIAAAPDFTEDLIRPSLTHEQKSALEQNGAFFEPSPYGDPLPITEWLLADGERHLLMRQPIPFAGPVHLLQGQEDPDVPWMTAINLAANLTSPSVTVELVKDGDHRLSRPEDLRRIAAACDRILAQVEGRPFL
ncbi:MAG TPA: alpha/beta hydrolase [Geminicoccus sp.]|jgi:pimeloyl-ACP methyl ester carboxylesterase|uniref:alpha/beta fold hydrolase n=1 Tax=Geminicoccus sp. TaxID=2024832 RepID=UPI002E32C4EE|nr:alpha/beta hydrolase [Geminicoccus sp.]HEX2527055.1 alpha/beta hydrolase [Geminicoccus sp.]